MRLLIFIMMLIPPFAFGQKSKLIGMFTDANKQSGNFLIFKSDSTFEYPSEYPMFEKVSVGRYQTKGDTVLLSYPPYRVDTIVGISKGVFIGLGTDSSMKVKQDTLILAKGKLSSIYQMATGDIRKGYVHKVKCCMHKEN